MTRNEALATIALTIMTAIAVSMASTRRPLPDTTPEPLVAPKTPAVVNVLRLEGSDGRLYVVSAPDPLDIAPSTCFLYVNPPAASSMTCVVSQISLAQMRP